MKKTKKSVKPSTNNNKKEDATKSKQALNKSVERRKKGGLNLTTESNKNSTIEARNVRDKINVIKPTKKDGDEKKSSSVSHRTNKSTKTKDYNNDEEKEKGGDFLYKAMYKTKIDNNKGYSIENMSTPDSQKVQKNNDISKPKENPISQPAGSQFAISMERTDDIIYDIGDKKIHSNINMIINQVMIEKVQMIQPKKNIMKLKIRKLIIIRAQIMKDQALALIPQEFQTILLMKEQSIYM